MSQSRGSEFIPRAVLLTSAVNRSAGVAGGGGARNELHHRRLNARSGLVGAK